MTATAQRRRLVVPPPFSPLDFGTRLALWRDASRLGLADGVGVATWPDLSGNGRDLAQATALLQPLVVAAGSRSGLPVVRFDTTKWMQQAAFTAVPQPFTRFMVLRSTAGQYKDGPALGAVRNIVGRASSVAANIYAGTAFANTGSGVLANLSIVVGVFDGAASYARLDGAGGAVASIGTGGWTGDTYGGTYFGTSLLNGDWAEDIIVADRLENRAIRRVERALNAKWNRALMAT